ncbi:hypothetical protein Anapl_11332 [Anas platyrhynchos]|uniref:Uncharacterized protein n=1 Tax=Anas platyrhynchos TaxID=8839 RepID=R0KMD8_ANAPL|nr:hypothetical protein Anapl_11332 [Anas platyrhynchos]
MRPLLPDCILPQPPGSSWFAQLGQGLLWELGAAARPDSSASTCPSSPALREGYPRLAVPSLGTAFLVSRIFLPAKPEVTAGYGKLFAKAGVGLWAVWKVYEQFCIRTGSALPAGPVAGPEEPHRSQCYWTDVDQKWFKPLPLLEHARFAWERWHGRAAGCCWSERYSDGSCQLWTGLLVSAVCVPCLPVPGATSSARAVQPSREQQGAAAAALHRHVAAASRTQQCLVY